MKKGRTRRSKFDNQKYISLIISPFINNHNYPGNSNRNTTSALSISAFFDEKILKMNNFLIILVSWIPDFLSYTVNRRFLTEK